MNFRIPSFLFNQSINSCIMLPNCFHPRLSIRCQAISHSSSVCLFFCSFIISCISIRTHTDLTSPPVNHHRGRLFQIQAAPPLPPCILTGLSGAAVQRSRPAGMEDAHQTNICPQTRKPTHAQTFRKLMFCKVHAGSGSQEHQQRWCFLSKVI